MIGPLLLIGGGALLLILASKKTTAATGSFEPQTDGMLTPITSTPTTGKSGINWVSNIVGSDDAKNTIRIQVILNDTRTGHPNHLVLTYDAVRGSDGARTFVSRGPKTTDGLLEQAMSDFAVKT
jgi:hypothetical protein